MQSSTLCCARVAVAGLTFVVSACADEATVVSSNPQRSMSLVIVSGNGQTAAVGTTLEQPFVVALRDPSGRPAANRLIHFYDRQLLQRDSSLTDGNGIASVRWSLVGKASVQEIVAAASVAVGAPSPGGSVTFTVTALPGTPTRLRVTRIVPMALPGTVLDTLAATLTDRFDNAIAMEEVAWDVESGGGSVVALSSHTNLSGKVRAVWTLGSNRGTNTLAVASAGLSATTSTLSTPAFPATMVATGGPHTCALAPGGAAYCWGFNSMGQLGNGQVIERGSPWPTPVSGGLTFTTLVAGTFHVCGLTKSGEAYCWGGNGLGQVGISQPVASEPTRVAPDLRFTALAAGSLHTCGLTTSGMVVCWGDDTVGQLGSGRERSEPEWFGSTHRSTPAPVSTSALFVELVAAYHATCGVTTTGRVYCWGSNKSSELGTATGPCRMKADRYYYREDWDWACSTRPVPIDLGNRLGSLSAAAFGFCGLTAPELLVC